VTMAPTKKWEMPDLIRNLRAVYNNACEATIAHFVIRYNSGAMEVAHLLKQQGNSHARTGNDVSTIRLQESHGKLRGHWLQPTTIHSYSY
jgi:hypothetical protein